MATYVVGDVQGCYQPLQRLLDRCHFDPERDQLWAVGDFVNRGPQSADVLRLFRTLGASFRGVLGNHDLHLLAVASGTRPMKRRDTLQDVLDAPDAAELLNWLRHQPLALYERGYLMVHAGVVPDWDLATTLQCARQLEAVVRGPDSREYFEVMYGDTPEAFHESLRGWHRLRVITNVLTRIRFCSADGRLDLECKKGPSEPPKGMLPWFAHAHRRTRDVPILFGHWAAARGDTGNSTNVFALDTGCVWGEQLTALCLEDQRLTRCECGLLD